MEAISSNFMYLIAQDVPKRTKPFAKGNTHEIYEKVVINRLAHFLLPSNFRSDCAFATPVVWLVTLLLSRR